MRESYFFCPGTSSETGMTLIELIVVIVIIGILATGVIAWFASSETNARQATVESVAAALTASASANFTLSKSGNPRAISVTNCDEVPNTLPSSQPLSSGYMVISTPLSTWQQSNCTLIGPGGVTATFVGIGT